MTANSLPPFVALVLASIPLFCFYDASDFLLTLRKRRGQRLINERVHVRVCAWCVRVGMAVARKAVRICRGILRELKKADPDVRASEKENLRV